MGYSSSPRPTYSGPTAIPYESVTRHLWGDEQSGEVADWIYVSTDKIHQLVFGLPPGGAFRHSEEYRTVFAADEVMYVLGGTMLLCNPKTGEVHRLHPGQAAFFRRDTWHHAYNYSTEPLRVLEFFAPPPSQGTSGAYARAQPYLETPRYTRDEWIGQWPAAQSRAEREASIRVLRDQDVLWRLEGQEQPLLVGILAATEHLTVGVAELLPGQKSELHAHGGDESLYVLDGTLHLRAPTSDGQRWFELEARDGFYIPEGTPHQYYNISDRVARLVFGVAPHYFARQEA